MLHAQIYTQQLQIIGHAVFNLSSRKAKPKYWIVVLHLTNLIILNLLFYPISLRLLSAKRDGEKEK